MVNGIGHEKRVEQRRSEEQNTSLVSQEEKEKEKEKAKMRWILFQLFVGLYCLFAVFTLIVLVGGVKTVSESERSLFVKLFMGEVGCAVLALFYSLVNRYGAQRRFDVGGWLSWPRSALGDKLKKVEDRLATMMDQLKEVRTEINTNIKKEVNNILFEMHNTAIHSILDFAVGDYDLGREDPTENEHLYASYRDLANSCRDALAKGINLGGSDLRCSIKICEKNGEKKEDWSVWTTARSTGDPFAGPLGRKQSCLVGQNSAFAALIGTPYKSCSDSHQNWQQGYRCFACNDLTKYRDETKPTCYMNTRKHWWEVYSSCLIFPLAFIRQPAGERDVKGFLTFDSGHKGIFVGVPDIFEHLDNITQYNNELEKNCPVFHIGAIMTDILTSLMLLAEGVGKKKSP